MADITRIKDLTNELATLGDNDYIPVEDMATGETKKIKKSGILSGLPEATATTKGLTSAVDKETINKKLTYNFGFFSFSHYKLTTDNISFVTNGTGNDITVKGDLWIQDENNKNLVYFGNNAAHEDPIISTGTYDSATGVYTFPLLHNDCLIYNTNTKTVSKRTFGATGTIYDVLLAFCHNGEIKGGAFYHISNWLRLKKAESDVSPLSGTITKVNLLNRYLNLWYPENLIYIYPGNATYKTYIKFDKISEKTAAGAKTWAQLKTDINDPAKFGTSPTGVTDCLMLADDYVLVLDTTTNTFSIISRSAYDQTKHIIMCFSEWGRGACGLLVDMFLAFKSGVLATIGDDVPVLKEYNALWYPESNLYIENSSSPDAVFLKFDKFSKTSSGGQKTWDGLKTDINDSSKFGTSPLGVTDCLMVPDDSMLIMDTTTRKYSIIARGSYDQTKHILMLNNEWGRASGGLFLQQYFAYKINDINKIAALSADSVLPTYVTMEVNSTINAVFAKQDVKTVSFAFMNDIHYTTGAVNIIHAIRALKEIIQNVKVEFLALGGDNVGNSAKANVLSYINDLAKQLKYYLPGMNIFPVMGNHDDNSIYDVSTVPTTPDVDTIYPVDWYKRFFKFNENKNISLDLANREKFYYYVDMPDSKLRVIFLNSIDIPYTTNPDGSMKYTGQWDFAFRNEQLNWFASKALDFSSKGTDKSNWGIAIFSHVPLEPTIVTGDGETAPENATVLINILKAFKAGSSYTSSPTTGDFGQSVSVDFTTQGAMEVIGCINGHFHGDRLRTLDGINYINCLSAATNSFGTDVVGEEKVPGTADETAFDIFTIDRVNKKIYTSRYGKGDDRVINY